MYGQAGYVGDLPGKIADDLFFFLRDGHVVRTSLATASAGSVQSTTGTTADQGLACTRNGFLQQILGSIDRNDWYGKEASIIIML
jgi:hypothetical protein